MTDNPQNLTVGAFMTTQPCTVDEELNLADAQDRMDANNIRHLLVSRDGRMVGIISSRDTTFAASLPGFNPKKVKVQDAMSNKVYTCRPTDDLTEVAWHMEAHRYGCAVVVDEDTVVGIFTTTDALRALRQVIAGRPVAPGVTPTHKPAVGAERDVVAHHTRVSSALASAHAGPSHKDGMMR